MFLSLGIFYLELECWEGCFYLSTFSDEFSILVVKPADLIAIWGLTIFFCESNTFACIGLSFFTFISYGFWAEEGGIGGFDCGFTTEGFGSMITSDFFDIIGATYIGIKGLLS